MEDLAQWLRTQLDQDHAALLRYRDGHNGPCLNYAGQDPADYDDYDSCTMHLKAAEGAPYRDADFGLREIDAKRRILDEHELVQTGEGRPPGCTVCVATFSWGPEVVEGPCPTLRLLALPYADRPGYQDSWRP